MKKTNGITLIALIITIILMLILASITVTVAINGGLFEYAGGAKDSVEIANEKDIVSEAFMWAESNSKTGRVTVEDLQKNVPTDVDATVMDTGDTLVVKFNKNNRYYEIENSGKVEGPIEFVKDDYAGDITKGGAYDGSVDKPFKITCIEDLVAFSIMTDAGNSELGLKSSYFTNQYVELTRTLDFKSIFSYKDYTTTIYGDLNTDGKVEDIRTELTRIDDGCIGFPAITSFCGTFNGKGNTIANIYQYSTSARALFVNPLPGRNIRKIENLNISGNITSSENSAAGFCCGSVNTISNCKNYANITGYQSVGGISEWSCDIIDCENYGTIQKTGGTWMYSGVGGILGISSGSIIKNCTNFGKVEGDSNSAGILGSMNGADEKEVKIINCINRGQCDAGIINYLHNGKVSILNCCNLGKTSKSGIVRYVKNDLTISNCYTAGIAEIAILSGRYTSYELNITSTYYDQTKSTTPGAVTEGVVALNEEDIKNNETFIQTLNNNIGENTEWKRWKLGEDGWPTFE